MSELRAIADGDAEAFARWVASAEHAIRASLARFAEAVDVEVVVQETLLRMWQVAPRMGDDERPNALLRLALVSARNLAIDAARQNGRRVRTGDLEAIDDRFLGAAQPVLDPLLREAIERCRDELPKKPGAALAARLEGDGARHDRDLAARLNMKLNTFLKNIGRAKVLLAECLARRGVDVNEYLHGKGA